MEFSAHVEVLLNSVTLIELEGLVRGISHSQIIQAVKTSQHLQRVFRGFRPDHLPWSMVPSKLARDAQNDMGAKYDLLRMWLQNNMQLCEKVSSNVRAEAIEDDIVKLLASLGKNGADLLLWALLLDEREAIQAALKNGLRADLTTSTSSLLVRADHCRISNELEKARTEIAGLRKQIGDLEKKNKSLAYKAEQVDEAQRTLQNQVSRYEQLQGQLQELNNKQNEQLAEKEELQEALSLEKQNNAQLQRALTSLQSNLMALTSNRGNDEAELQGKLKEALKLLEEEKKEALQLRLRSNKLEREVEIAYTKRDEERERRETLETQVERLQRGKQAIIKQLQTYMKEKDMAFDNEQQQNILSDQIVQTTGDEGLTIDASLPSLESSWQLAVESVSHHLDLIQSDQSVPREHLTPEGRWEDWKSWQQMEALLVQTLLFPLLPLSEEKQRSLEKIQKLLSLRWYLLEWLKFNGTKNKQEEYNNTFAKHRGD
jgi:myosin heavy subunit